MLTEEQYGNELGTRLRHETEDVRASPDLARKLRRLQSKRKWTIRTAIAVPVAAAAVVAVTVTTTTAPSNEAVGTTPVPTENVPVENLPVENVAHVQAQTIQAVSQASQYVIQTKNTYSSGYYDEWVDKATQRYRNDVYDENRPATRSKDGRMTMPPPPSEQKPAPIELHQSHATSGPEGNQDTVGVDYRLKQWWTGHDTHPKPTDIPDITDADSIRKAVADGTLELVGRENVEGKDTQHLRLFGPKRSYRIDMWVDSKTYLPVKETAAKGGGKAGTDQEFPAAHTVTATYTWLPRTEENLARLVLTAPPGFEKVK